MEYNKTRYEDVKRFLKDAIPLFDASYEILNNLQKSIHKNKYDGNKDLRFLTELKRSGQ